MSMNLDYIPIVAPNFFPIPFVWIVTASTRMDFLSKGPNTKSASQTS